MTNSQYAYVEEVIKRVDDRVRETLRKSVPFTDDRQIQLAYDVSRAGGFPKDIMDAAYAIIRRALGVTLEEEQDEGG